MTGTERTLPADEHLLVDHVEFSFDKDGDLEIDIGTHSGRGDGRWEGSFLLRENAIRLRDYLNRMLP